MSFDSLVCSPFLVGRLLSSINKLLLSSLSLLLLLLLLLLLFYYSIFIKILVYDSEMGKDFVNRFFLGELNNVDYYFIILKKNYYYYCYYYYYYYYCCCYCYHYCCYYFYLPMTQIFALLTVHLVTLLTPDTTIYSSYCNLRYIQAFNVINKVHQQLRPHLHNCFYTNSFQLTSGSCSNSTVKAVCKNLVAEFAILKP